MRRTDDTFLRRNPCFDKTVKRHYASQRLLEKVSEMPVLRIPHIRHIPEFPPPTNGRFFTFLTELTKTPYKPGGFETPLPGVKERLRTLRGV